MKHYASQNARQRYEQCSKYANAKQKKMAKRYLFLHFHPLLAIANKYLYILCNRYSPIPRCIKIRGKQQNDRFYLHQPPIVFFVHELSAVLPRALRQAVRYCAVADCAPTPPHLSPAAYRTPPVSVRIVQGYIGLQEYRPKRPTPRRRNTLSWHWSAGASRARKPSAARNTHRLPRSSSVRVFCLLWHLCGHVSQRQSVSRCLKARII